MIPTIIKTSPVLMVAAFTLPLAFGIGLTIRSWQATLIRLGPWSALAAVAAVIGVPTEEAVSFSWLLLKMHLAIDSTGRLFLLVTSLLWLLSGIYAQGYLASDPKRGRFFFFFLLSMAGNFGLIVSQDAVSFYVFFALMSFSSYGLVVHNGDDAALKAGRVYIYLVVIGEVLLFTAFVWQAWSVDSLLIKDFSNARPNGIIVGLILIGFGIKAGALPVHVWLPLAHPAAPTPASAVLSGAMIKAGLLGWLRFLPIGVTALPQWGTLCIVAGLLAAYYAVFVGLTQRNPKTVLAYSSISQMGLMTVGVGLALGWPQTVPMMLPAIAIYAVHHGFAKGALFLGVGLMAAADSRRSTYRLAIAGLILASLALAGAPFTSGAIAKMALKLPLEEFQGFWIDGLKLLLSAAAVGTTLLMARFLFIVTRPSSAHGQTPLGIWFSWAFTVLLTAATVWLLPEIRQVANMTLQPQALWQSLWPVVTGIVVSGSVWLTLILGKWRPAFNIPQGDLLIVIDTLFRASFSGARTQQQRMTQFISHMKKDLWARRPKFQGISRLAIRIENRLLNWQTASLIFILLIGGLFVLSLNH